MTPAPRHGHIPDPRTPRQHSIPAWTAPGRARQQAKFHRSMAWLAGYTAARREFRDVLTELRQVKAELAQARARLDRGRELAELLRRERHLTGLLLADDDLADCTTDSITLEQDAS